MAKSSRSSTRKSNNQRLKRNVFGPVEAARMQRLSQRLLDVAAQPKPESSDADMKLAVEGEEETTTTPTTTTTTTTIGEAAAQETAPTAASVVDDEDVAMDADAAHSQSSLSPNPNHNQPKHNHPSSSTKKRGVGKRRKTSKIVFPTYKDKQQRNMNRKRR